MKIPKPVLIALVLFVVAWSDPQSWSWPSIADLIPSVTPAPITEQGLRVLVVEETGDRETLPREQLLTITTTGWREYVKSKGGDFRILDQSLTVEQVAKDAKWVQEAMAVKRESVPWIVVSNGKTGYSGPLPKNTEEMHTLLYKYGGQP